MEDVTNVMDSPREQNSFLPTADSLAGCQRIQVNNLMSSEDPPLYNLF